MVIIYPLFILSSIRVIRATSSRLGSLLLTEFGFPRTEFSLALRLFSFSIICSAVFKPLLFQFLRIVSIYGHAMLPVLTIVISYAIAIASASKPICNHPST
ncbi:MAG: hypothetical protein LBC71_01395 [Oscillospiraceae bacterium]|nr:hypothetical protein [Oscillospiraceae bacterium]